MFSPKQQKVARLIRLGYNYKTIADTFGTSPQYIKEIVQQMGHKLGKSHERHKRVFIAVWYVQENRKNGKSADDEIKNHAA